MKFLVKTDADQTQRDFGSGGYSVPNSTITWISVIYVIINIISNSLGNFISNYPQRTYDNKAFEIKNQNFQLQMLQRVLETNNEKDRRLSLELLVKAGLLTGDKDNNLIDFIKTNEYIPQWPSRTLETLNSYLPNQGNSYVPSTVNYSNVGSGTLKTPPGNINNTTIGNSGGSVPRSNYDSSRRSGN